MVSTYEYITMANRVLRFTFFLSIFCCDVSAQESEGLIYNFNEPIAELDSELRTSEIFECYANLLSISNLESNYLTKVRVPNSLLDFLIAKRIVQPPLSTIELERKVFILARYIHSVEYESYLLIVKENNVMQEFEMINVLLVNVRDNVILSLCELASYFGSSDGDYFQSYSIYQANDVFERRHETIATDVELIQEEDKVKQKQGESFKTTIIVDSETGKISRK